MDKPFDLKVLQLKENLISEINNSNLPISVVFFVCKELLEAVSTQQNIVINSLKESEKKEDEDNGEN